jgi:hypothetical protein
LDSLVPISLVDQNHGKLGKIRKVREGEKKRIYGRINRVTID